jgi:phytoene/squalene synthetase
LLAKLSSAIFSMHAKEYFEWQKEAAHPQARGWEFGGAFTRMSRARALRPASERARVFLPFPSLTNSSTRRGELTYLSCSHSS